LRTGDAAKGVAVAVTVAAAEQNIYRAHIAVTRK
jgi:hypothetical protein